MEPVFNGQPVWNGHCFWVTAEYRSDCTCICPNRLSKGVMRLVYGNKFIFKLLSSSACRLSVATTATQTKGNITMRANQKLKGKQTHQSAGKHEFPSCAWFLFRIWLVERLARFFWTNQRVYRVKPMQSVDYFSYVIALLPTLSLYLDRNEFVSSMAEYMTPVKHWR